MRPVCFALALSLAAPAVASDVAVKIAPDMDSATVETLSGPVVIERIQDPAHEVTGEWARTSRPCPSFCVQPMIAAEGVTTIGELELIALLQDPEAIVIDSRTSDWFTGGNIPGAISIPYTYCIDELGQLG